MKHAYLIIAHNEPYILEKQLKLIDDERNDIYIHIDKKWKNFDFDYFKKIVKKSNLYFIPRLDVRWGTYRQIECELLLLKMAYSNKYAYYHLISGIDMPLKSQDEIHAFFNENNGYEFIHFDCYDSVKEETIERIKYYHLFTSKFRNKGLLAKIYNSLHFHLIRFQKKLKINRCKDLNIRKGANWFSITNDLAGYIISNEKFIKKYFKYSYCSDELFVQTLVYNSKFYNNLYLKKDDDYMSIMRYIDWNRGEPYIFKSEDFNDLINSKYLFARKFSTKVDKKIIDKIYDHIKGDFK